MQVNGRNWRNILPPALPEGGAATWLPIAAGAAGALWGELRAVVAALRSPVLALLLAGLLGALLLAATMPLHYSFDVGLEEGYGGDLPHLRGFNTAERDEHGSYRWTADKAQIVLPGVGHRPLNLQLDFFPISPEAVARGPDVINIWVAARAEESVADGTGELLAVLPVRREGARYHLHIPANRVDGGTLALTIRTHTFVPANPDDPRALGTPLDRVTVSAPTSRGPRLPDGGATGMWLLACVCFWLTIRRALAPVPHEHGIAAGFVALAVGSVALAALLDPPRWAFGAQPALIVGALGYLLVLLLRPTLRWLAARFAIPLDARTLGWLLLIIVLAFGLRYGGRLYPRSMHGDIGFHTNRFNEVARGHIFLLSRNRGVDFPYPPGPYVLLVPFALLRPDPPALLQLGAALTEGVSAALVYTILARTGVAYRRWRHSGQPPPLARQPEQRDRNTALMGAAIYVFTAAGFMTTWWSFDTHIYAQALTLLLLTVLHDVGLRRLAPAGSPDAAEPSSGPGGGRGGWVVVGFVLCGLVFLGHFGFFINTVLLGGLVLLLLALVAWQTRGTSQATAYAGVGWRLALVGVGATLVALALFYSYFAPLLTEQAQIAATGGLTELAQRRPVERAYLWQVLWDAGLIQHFGFFPLLLAPLGLRVLQRRGGPARVTLALLTGTFLVSLVFAVLPFLTLSTQSTRWLMFAAWAVAVSAALAVPLLWQRGRIGRLVVVAMAGFVGWNTLLLWGGPMLWRIRPPEPF